MNVFIFLNLSKSLIKQGNNQIIMNFNQKVWDVCRQIPKGKITTYKAIAEKLNTKAYRAVGSALKKNPYAPKVPCHRVVNSDGTIGGYKGIRNNNEKIRLLNKEGIITRKGNIVNFKQLLYLIR